MNHHIDFTLKLYERNKKNGRMIAFAPQSIYTVVSMIATLKRKTHLSCDNVAFSFLNHIFDETKKDFPDTYLSTGRSSTNENYVILEDDDKIDYSLLSDYNILGLFNVNDVSSIVRDYTVDHLSLPVVKGTKIINSCYMIQPLPYTEKKVCSINYYWYRLIQEFGITVISFHPTYQHIRITMILTNKDNMSFLEANMSIENILDWTSCVYMKRSTLPFKIPEIKISSSIEITPILYSCTCNKEKSACSVYCNSFLEIKPGGILFASITGASLESALPSFAEVDNGDDDSETNFIIIIEDIVNNTWLFFGVAR